MMERQSKLCSLEEAVANIPNGARVAFGGFAIYQKPMALAQQLVRAGKKNLTIIGALNSIEADMLIGAGCVARIETSYVGLEKYGLAPNYRRAVQQGKIEVVYYPEMLSWDRFRADRDAMPYWPVYFLGGSDIVKYNPDIIPFPCPVTGKPSWAVPAAKADFVLIHSYMGDAYGNLQLQPRHLQPQTMDVDMARGCDKVIATVENLVSTETIKQNPHLTMIPAFKTTYVVNAPHGSHPTATLLHMREDRTHFAEYVRAAASEEGFKAYLEEYVTGPGSFDGYLDKVGQSHLAQLAETKEG